MQCFVKLLVQFSVQYTPLAWHMAGGTDGIEDTKVVRLMRDVPRGTCVANNVTTMMIDVAWLP